MTDLNALIERLSRATGPDGNLDIDIYKASGQARAPDSSVMEFILDHDGDALWRVKHEGQDFGSWWHVPQFSFSIDAAMTLVPENCYWQVTRGLDDVGVPIGDGISHKNFSALVTDEPFTDNAKRVWAVSSPAIAICIAALSARTRTARGKSGAEDHSIQKAGIDAEQSVTKPSPASRKHISKRDEREPKSFDEAIPDERREWLWSAGTSYQIKPVFDPENSDGVDT